VSHPEQQAFLALVASANGALVDGSRVLEIGSYDVNGTVRRQFGRAREYVGVDLTPGPGVDRVAFGHEVDDPDGAFDVTLSGECFEHDPHWRDTFSNMVRLTRAGGLVTFTCASTGRPEHGTGRTDPAMSPGTQAVGSDYYRNLAQSDFDDLPLTEWFESHRFWYLPTSFDLYFVGVRTGGHAPRGVLPKDGEDHAVGAPARTGAIAASVAPRGGRPLPGSGAALLANGSRFGPHRGLHRSPGLPPDSGRLGPTLET
jgi:SAM-dependent methyltransferase